MKRLAMILWAVGLAVPAAAQDASGQWQITVTTSDRGPRTTTMGLKKDGEKLSGTIIGPQGAELPLAGTQTGSDVSLSFSFARDTGTITVVLKGRQDGESMKGVIQVDGQGQGDWTANRTAAPAAVSGASAVDVSGTWALQVLVNGETRTPTAVLKQESERLSGVYKSMLGEAPISGQIKDKAFTFQTTITQDGNPLTVTYKGTVEASAMKGDVTVADLASGTFTGKKQDAGGK